MTAQAAQSQYIVSPLYDWAFFLLPPGLSLLAGIAISGTGFSDADLTISGVGTTGAGLVIGTIIHAHLVAVFFRSHGNRQIFELHRVRFVLVPIALYFAIVASTWVAVIASVVATFWDVWHSGAQTFGFARIYDRNLGSPPEGGRRLDYWLNQLLYAGPILGGATLMDHMETFEEFEDVDAVFFTSIPAHVDGVRGILTWIVLGVGVVFLLAYVHRYRRLARQGYRVSPLKTWLLVSTGLCSIVTWGFNSWGEAFFIMNLFHAVQYLALVWAVERRRIVDLFRMGGRPSGGLVAGALFLLGVLAYGIAVQLIDLHTFWALTMVVSLMHFWYDGFIWSVRKRQI